jgi:hypothetical protein
VNSLSRILAILRKEVRQLRRDRLTFGMVVGLPIIQMLLFGYAINTDVRNLRSAVADRSGTHLSRQFIAELAQTQVIDIVERVDTPQQLEDLLRQGRISIGVHIPHDFDRRDAGRVRLDATRDGHTSRDRSPSLLQPGAPNPGQHRAGPDGCHPDDDDDPVHSGRDRPRA